MGGTCNLQHLAVLAEGICCQRPSDAEAFSLLAPASTLHSALRAETI